MSLLDYEAGYAIGRFMNKVSEQLDRIEANQKEILQMSASTNAIIAKLQSDFAQFQTDFGKFQTDFTKAQTDQSALTALIPPFLAAVKQLIASAGTPGSGTTLSAADAAILQGLDASVAPIDAATQQADASSQQADASAQAAAGSISAVTIPPAA